MNNLSIGRNLALTLQDGLSYPWVEAIAITEPTFEKIVLMLDATPGITAPAATATKPAIKAYSMRSCPRVSLIAFSFKRKFFMLSPSFLSLTSRQFPAAETKLSSDRLSKNQALGLRWTKKSSHECDF